MATLNINAHNSSQVQQALLREDRLLQELNNKQQSVEASKRVLAQEKTELATLARQVHRKHQDVSSASNTVSNQTEQTRSVRAQLNSAQTMIEQIVRAQTLQVSPAPQGNINLILSPQQSADNIGALIKAKV